MGRPKGIPLTPEHKAKLIAGSVAAHLGKSVPFKNRTPTERRFLKTCLHCKNEFEAKAQTTKWCFVCGPDSISRSRIRTYGISKVDWDRILKDQAGHCALCDREPTAVDHDHETGVVRGILCHACNIVLNRVEIAGWTEKATAYVQRGKNRCIQASS